MLLLNRLFTLSRSSLFLTAPQQEDWRRARGWEGTKPGQLTWIDQSSIPKHLMSCPAIQIGMEFFQSSLCMELAGLWSMGGEWLLFNFFLTFFLLIFVYFCPSYSLCLKNFWRAWFDMHVFVLKISHMGFDCKSSSASKGIIANYKYFSWF